MSTAFIRGWNIAPKMETRAFDGHYMTWNLFYVVTLLLIIIPFYKAILCCHFKEAEKEYRENAKKGNKDFLKYVRKKLSRDKSKVSAQGSI